MKEKERNGKNVANGKEQKKNFEKCQFVKWKSKVFASAKVTKVNHL